MSSPLAGTRVVIVNNFPGPGLGGGEVQNLVVCRGLLAAGAELHAVVVPGSGFGAELAAIGATVTEAPMSPRTARRAASAIVDAAMGPQRAVLFGTGYFTNLLVRLAVGDAPKACTVNLVAVAPGASLADGGSRAGHALRQLADRASAGRVDAWVAVAGVVAEALVAGGAPRARVHEIANGVEVAALERAAEAPLPAGVPAGDAPLVVCAARLEAVKGVEHLVRAAALLPRARVAIAGDGPLLEQLRELAVELGLSDRLALLGRVTPVAPLLAAADVVVLPSRSEGLPMAALEAMALGKPVVASRVGGLPEAVEDGVTGVLVPPSDPDALAAALAELLGDPERARAMGEAGRARVLEGFTAERMVAGYVELFASLASR